MGPYFKKGLIGAAFVLVADQLSKWWVLEGLKLPEVGRIDVLPFFSFTMVWNPGIAMGLPGEALGPWGLTALTSAISLWLVFLLRKSVSFFEALGLTLILGGAIGNIIDRVVHGAVVDFLHLHAWDYNFYVFNVADSGVTIGVIILLIDSLRTGLKGPKNDAKGIKDTTD